MENAVIISDVHVDDFRSHNLFNNSRFRLNQFLKLADRIVNIVKDRQCKYIFIAGDFINRSSPRPYITNIAFEMLVKMSEVATVYLVAGQHDLDTRSNMQSTDCESHENTYLKLLSALPNVHYLHKEVIHIGNRSIGFSNWQPDLDLSWIDEKSKSGTVDIFIGHETISGSILSNGLVVDGSKIDTSRFKLGFFGDIHRHQVIGNIVIPGTPIQHSFGDHHDNGIIVCNIETLQWERIPTVSDNFKFLQFTTDEQKSNDPYVVYKAPKIFTKEKKVEIYKSLEVHTTLNKVMAKLNLGEFHREFFNQIKDTVVDEIDCDFKILNLLISNFRSIDSFIFTPKLGTTLIQGHIGSGKSTLVSAIRFALLDTVISKEFITVGKKKMSVDITIEYAGNEHRIVKGYDGSGFIQYYINGSLIEAENQAAIKTHISENLKFIQMFNVFYFNQTRAGFLSSYSYNERVSLISDLLNLKVLEQLSKLAKKSADEITEKMKIVLQSIAQKQAYIDIYKFTTLTNCVDFEVKKQALKNRLGKLVNIKSTMSKIFSLNSRVNVLTQLSSQFTENSFEEVNFIAKIAMFKQMLNTNTLHINKLKSEIQSIQASNFEISKEISQITSALRRLNLDKIELEKRLESMKHETCYACGSLLVNSTLETMQADTQAQISKCLHQIEFLTAKISQYKTVDYSEIEAQLISSETKQKAILTKIATVQADEANQQKMQDSVKKAKLARIELDDVIAQKNLEDILLKNLVSDYEKDTEISTDAVDAQLIEVRDKISKLEQDEKHFKESVEILTKVADYQNEINTTLSEEVSMLQENLKRHTQYIDALSSKGEVLTSILSELSEILTRGNIRVRSFKTLSSGELRPDFDVDYFVGDKWIKYDLCSEGEKTLIDMNILTKLLGLLGTLGILIFDETLKFLDDSNTDATVQLINSLNCNHTFIISHAQNFPYADNLIQVNKTEKGVSNFQIL